MSESIITIILAFLEGFALVVSPCVLPIIPLMLAGAMVGNERRVYGMLVGFVLTFSTIAAFAKFIVSGLHLDLNLLRHAAYAVLFLLGLILLSSRLSLWFSVLTQRIADFGQQRGRQITDYSFFSGLLWGGLLALIWTPCAGPILAAVLVQISIQTTTFKSFYILLAFSLGVALPLTLIGLLGVHLQSSISFFKRHAESVRRGLGVLVLGSLIYMIAAERFVANQDVSKYSIRTTTSLLNGLWKTYPAPELGGIDQYINSKPFKISDLKGKVVLVDFWTYSCINCVRTLPYLKDWYKKYHDQGFEIVGVHTPEFDFEKDPHNVERAVQAYGLTYPIVLDNHAVTWLNYDNHYWPAHYLIDKKGQVVYQHFGEGEYEVTENNIRYLLGVNSLVPMALPSTDKNQFFQTPETYFGYDRADPLYSPKLIPEQINVYQTSESLQQNSWSLQGAWLASPQQLIAKEKGASLWLHFYAKEVYFVLGNPSNHPINLEIEFNGKAQGVVTVQQYALYPILKLDKAQKGILRIKCLDPGVEVYTATFGS